MQAATFTAVVVLPTPPFWFAIAYTVPMRLLKLAARSVGGRDHLFATEAASPSTRGLDRSFAGHSRAAGVASGRRPDLRAEVEVSFVRPGEGLNGDGFGLAQPERRRGCAPIALLPR